MKQCDRKTVVVGAGYIAVELAGILKALGSDVSLLIRYDKVASYVICVILHVLWSVSLCFCC